MISLSSILWGNSSRMDEILLSMDTQLRLYLWTISEMNRIRSLAEVSQNSNRNHIYKKGVITSHYKKKWRDRYIKPDSTPLTLEDPLKMMDKLVNDCHTYNHVMEYKKCLSHIVEEFNSSQIVVPLSLKYRQFY